MKSTFDKLSSEFSLHRISATDGTTLDIASNPHIHDLFSLANWTYGKAIGNPYQDHAYRPSVLGCAYSHYSIWKTIASESASESTHNDKAAHNNNFYVVFEDDITIEESFNASKWLQLRGERDQMNERGELRKYE